jgi:Spy/CpxP family protein refolding chaperone
MRVVSVVLALAISLLTVGNALADTEKKCARKGHAQSAERREGFGGLSRLNLSADQQAKVAELKKEYGPKFKEIWEAKKAILTPEQKKARDEAISAAKAAKAEGKKPGNVRKAIAAAVNLSPEQQAKMAKLDKAAAELRTEVRTKVLAVLTPEQVAQLKEMKKAHHHKCQREKGSQSTATGS